MGFYRPLLKNRAENTPKESGKCKSTNYVSCLFQHFRVGRLPYRSLVFYFRTLYTTVLFSFCFLWPFFCKREPFLFNLFLFCPQVLKDEGAFTSVVVGYQRKVGSCDLPCIVGMTGRNSPLFVFEREFNGKSIF